MYFVEKDALKLKIDEFSRSTLAFKQDYYNCQRIKQPQDGFWKELSAPMRAYLVYERIDNKANANDCTLREKYVNPKSEAQLMVCAHASEIPHRLPDTLRPEKHPRDADHGKRPRYAEEFAAGGEPPPFADGVGRVTAIRAAE